MQAMLPEGFPFNQFCNRKYFKNGIRTLVAGIIDILGFMFIIRFPYSHQYRSVIIIVYWSEYPDEVIEVLYQSYSNYAPVVKIDPAPGVTLLH